MIPMVPLNSIKRFHGIPWILECTNADGISSLMEFDSWFQWYEKFHGIPRNLEWSNFEDMMRSISFPMGHQQWNFFTFSRLFHDQVPIFADFLQHENMIFWSSHEFTWITHMPKSFLQWPFGNKANLRDLKAATGLLSGNAQFGSKSVMFCPVWPWNLMDDLGKQ